MKSALLLFFLTGLLASCTKAKEAIAKTGDALGQASATFFSKVADGIDHTLEGSIKINPNLTDKGLALGQDKVSSFATAGRNVLTVYFIFNQDFKETITVKVLDEQGHEYGRTTLAVTGKKGETRNVDFTFDEHTTIKTKSTFTME